jgi:flagellar basal-body rod protein FlgB
VNLFADLVDRIPMTTTSSIIEQLTGVLDVASLRHRVIAQNVANVNTPGYHRQELTFDKMLASQQSGSLAGVNIVEDETAIPRADGNTVQLDREMADLAKNQLLYNAAVQLLSSRLGTLRAAIAGR